MPSAKGATPAKTACGRRCLLKTTRRACTSVHTHTQPSLSANVKLPAASGASLSQVRDGLSVVCVSPFVRQTVSCSKTQWGEDGSSETTTGSLALAPSWARDVPGGPGEDDVGQPTLWAGGQPPRGTQEATKRRCVTVRTTQAVGSLPIPGAPRAHERLRASRRRPSPTWWHDDDCQGNGEGS